MKQRFTNKKGFTLMELLIVIVILGFLLGMLVPRLGGVTDGAIDNVCDSNNKGARYYTKVFLDENGRYPAKMINLVNRTGDTQNTAGAYVLPTVEDKDSDNGPETLAREFYLRNVPTVRAITAGEAEELIAELGISYVVNLNDFVTGDRKAVPGSLTKNAAQGAQAAGTDADMYEENPVGENLGMAFVGDVSAADAIAGWNASATADYPKGNPNWAGRIILGLGKHCELITGGLIQAAALCPGGVQNADNVNFNNYCVILPRLAATITADGGLVADAEHTFGDAAGESTEKMVVTIEAQEKWAFDFTCPEGHKWPDNDNDEWIVE